MANYRKSFSFRNGVQVDDDNLVVNSNGLVGVGTTVPTEILDVRGTTKVVGLVTANHIFTPALNVSGVGTFGTISDGKIQISSGIITAVSGVVTFYGDGIGLVNIPTSQWIDTDVGLGFTSIYAAGNVGIATSDPRFTLQIGANPDTNGSFGVGINSTGNIKASGIVTASSFVGNLVGNLAGNVNSTGVGTFNNLKVDTVTIGSGVVTATTFRGSVVGNVTGTASTATSLSGTPNITVGIVTASKIVADLIEVPNTGVTTVSKLLHIGTGGTAFSALEGGRIGVGTALPTSEIQIRKSSGSLVEVVSDSGQARISVGNSVGAGNSSAVLRFGNVNGVFDIINNDVGDIKTIIHAGTGAGSTGNFKWIYGQINAERMTLTYDGKLGINQTVPTNTLHVVGTSTVTGNAWFGGDITAAGNITGNVVLNEVITSNLNTTSGVSTISTLKVTNTVDFSNANFVGLGTNVGVGTDSGYQNNGLTVNNGIRANTLTLTDGLDVSSGYVTSFSVRSTSGFISSGVGTEFVQITYGTSPSRVIFTVPGVGSTSLRLF